MALAVTRTVAPVSARIAGHRPVMPRIVVTKNTALSPKAIVMFWRILPIVALDSSTMRAMSSTPAVQHGRIGGFQGHMGAAAHGNADIGRCQSRGIGERPRFVEGRRRDRAEGF